MSDTETPPRTCDYAGEQIVSRLNRMLSHLEGVRQGEDPRHIHQMRVWSRRSRAALDVFHPCFPGKGFADVAEEVKTVTGALGEARDLDVMIETLTARAATLPEDERSGIESFLAHLRSQRQQKQKAVERAIRQLERADLGKQFARVAAKAGVILPEPPPVSELADAITATPVAASATSATQEVAPATNSGEAVAANKPGGRRAKRPASNAAGIGTAEDNANG